MPDTFEDELDVLEWKLKQMKLKSRGDVRLPLFFHIDASENEV